MIAHFKCFKTIFSGYSDENRKRAFRPQYKQLHQLRAILPGVPCLALTATATTSTVETIIKDLALTECYQNCLSPHKTNIKYTVIKVGKATDYEKNLHFLVKIIADMADNAPRIIVFFRQMSLLTGAYEYVDSELGRLGYLNYNDQGPNDDRNHMVEMYVMKTDENVKNNIVKTFMNPKGHIRIVFCSASFSMGLNLRHLDNVIHYGVPTDLDEYLQQTGRAGRDENHQAHAIVLHHSDAIKEKNFKPAIKNLVKTADCRRVVLYKDYVPDITPLELGHKCCDNCAKKCDCSEDCDQCIPELVELLLKNYEIESSSDELESEGETFHSSSSSDIELYRQSKPIVLELSSDSN
jgi:superfamily II DNA helicase RecQ